MKLGFALGTSMLLALAACGSQDGLSEYKDPNGQDPNGQDPNGGSGGPGGTLGGNGSNGNKNGGTGPACATATAEAQNLPVYMVIMYDRSGSMNDNGKWGAAKAGMTSFFSSPDSKNASASLTFFPQGDACGVGTFGTPAVAMRALPDASTFKSQLDATTPNGGTPTLPALQGAIQYAQSQAASIGDKGKVVIVLVTDGIPNGCNSSIANVSSAAAAVKDKIPTFVIGVGDETASLNQIAVGGGTKSAILVSGTDPTKTQSDIRKALGDIKAQLSCDFKVPDPPAGQSLDYKAVNVVHTPTGGSPDTLSYNQSCSGEGWRYDDPAKPTRIIVCDASCNKIRQDAGKVEVQLGCATKGGVH
jgi:uncharacterized protein YegL